MLCGQRDEVWCPTFSALVGYLKGVALDAIIFLLILTAATVAIRAKRTWLVLAFTGIALLATLGLFLHHATDSLGVNL